MVVLVNNGGEWEKMIFHWDQRDSTVGTLKWNNRIKGKVQARTGKWIMYAPQNGNFYSGRVRMDEQPEGEWDEFHIDPKPR